MKKNTLFLLVLIVFGLHSGGTYASSNCEIVDSKSNANSTGVNVRARCQNPATKDELRIFIEEFCFTLGNFQLTDSMFSNCSTNNNSEDVCKRAKGKCRKSM